MCFEPGDNTKTLVMPGLDPASIDFARAFSKQMDAGSAGNDILMAFARKARRDREAVSRDGGCLKFDL
jgi:hypothetical protein